MIKSILTELLQESSLDIDLMQRRFDQYFALLEAANQQFNLTTIIDRANVDVLHFADSIIAAPFIPPNSQVLDVGSGAGFPALPLKIVRNDLNITMIDSVGKKVNFVNSVIKSLELDNIRGLHIRAEDLPKNKLYDVVISRAVAALNILLEYTLPFVKVGGRMIAYKSVNIDEELSLATNAIRVLGGKIEDVITQPLPNSDIRRKLIIITKVSPTPSQYPRPAGKPRLKPL